MARPARDANDLCDPRESHGIGDVRDPHGASTDAAGGRSLLDLWEAAAPVAPRHRGVALLRAAGQAPPRSLGEYNVRLLQLHAALFGPRMELLSHCPACGAAAEFSADAEAMAEQLAPSASAGPHRLAVLGHALQFRLPNPDDVAAAASADSAFDPVPIGDDTGGSLRPAVRPGEVSGEPDFARRLLARCIVDSRRDGLPVAAGDLPDAVLDALSQRLEALDPGAALSFALDCPQCATPWSAPLDAAEGVWQRLRAAAERLLLEVDALARAYGWREADVLALGPARRAAYLQMAAA